MPEPVPDLTPEPSRDPLEAGLAIAFGSASAQPAATLPDADAAASRLCDQAEPATVPPETAPGGLPAAVGRYPVTGELGRGGMGVVLQGRDLLLGRDLAIKVLAEKGRDNPNMAQRFLEEAQIGGRLQHPGVVPVYEVGRLAGGRPYFTMKLVQGRTLAALLKQRASPREDLPHFLKVFEQVCQTLAYAHARGVIHRDLKPSNVMVGGFGEVQVMDWGLAKDLASRGGQPLEQDGTPPGPHGPGSPDTDAARTPALTQQGAVLGTPAYMAPEQARGETDALDERCDVFGLGAILCEILTGQPPYVGAKFREVHDGTTRGELGEAFARLDDCGADAELLGLAKACLAPTAEDRPRDAGVVAREVSGYLASVQERLRAAELARAAAQARAEEQRKLAAQERRARQLTVALAASVLLFVVAGGAGWRWWESYQRGVVRQREEQAARLVREAEGDLDEARSLRAEADRVRDDDLTPLTKALARARQAEARLAGAKRSEELRRKARDLAAELEESLLAQRRQVLDRRMLARLEDLRLRQSVVRHGAFDTKQAEPEYRPAFREYGIRLDRLPDAEVVRRIRGSAIRVHLAAALDEWARLLEDGPARRRLYDLARRADPDDPFRNEVRAALARRDDKEALVKLARRADIAVLPPTTLHLLARELRQAGALAETVDLLRRAQRQYRGDFWLNHDLGAALGELRPARRDEATRYLMAALALRPQSPGVHVNLGAALLGLGAADEALHAFDRAVKLQKEYAEAYLGRAAARLRLDQLDAALTDCETALKLKPGLVEAYNTIGAVLSRRDRYEEAIPYYRKAARSRVPFAAVHSNLGTALIYQGRLEEGLAELEKAIQIDPSLTTTYNNLGVSLLRKGHGRGAAALFRKVVELDPKDALGHYNLGLALSKERAFDEAIASFRKAIALKEDYAEAHTYLGRELHRKGLLEAAIAAHRKALALKPGCAPAHNHLGKIVAEQGRVAEALDHFRAAVGFDAKYVDAHCNLAHALILRDELDEAVAHLMKALAVEPECAQAYNNLGIAYRRKRQIKEAEAACRKAIALAPNDYQAYNNLGAIQCDNLKDFDGAIASFRKVIELKPGLATAYCNLGNAHLYKGETAAALAAYYETLQRNPAYVEAHFGLGVTLARRKRLDESITAFRRVIELKPDHALAHCYLGLRLRDRGRFVEALAAVTRGHELGQKLPHWPYPSAKWVETCERLVKLDGRLPAILADKDQPADASEALQLGRLCRYKGQFAVSARFYAGAFRMKPALAQGPGKSNRYDAACVAALAGWGKGGDAAGLGDKGRARLRGEALDWLRAELAMWEKELSGGAEARAAVRRELADWQANPDLAGLRDPAELARLPESEPEACRRLWADVERLLRTARHHAKTQ
jgi:serine/threonine-protein kinase